jgi:hypothetical protein
MPLIAMKLKYNFLN